MIRRPPRSTLFPHTPLSRPPPREPDPDRPGGVARIAAPPQNVHADVARERMRGDHHGMLAGDGLDAQAERPGGRDARVPSPRRCRTRGRADRKSTRLNSSHLVISYAVFCLKKKNSNGVVAAPLAV